jgi:hypothetical protein
MQQYENNKRATCTFNKLVETISAKSKNTSHAPVRRPQKISSQIFKPETQTKIEKKSKNLSYSGMRNAINLL